jgi:hypothetical protein
MLGESGVERVGIQVERLRELVEREKPAADAVLSEQHFFQNGARPGA